jgi:hypothetical protein
MAFVVGAFSPRSGRGKLWSEGASTFDSKAAATKYFADLRRNGYPAYIADDDVVVKVGGMSLAEARQHGRGRRPGYRLNPMKTRKAPKSAIPTKWVAAQVRRLGKRVQVMFRTKTAAPARRRRKPAKKRRRR